MDIYSLKNYLINNSDLIELVLYEVGFEDVSDNFKDGTEYRCAWEEGANPTAVRVKKETLAANCYTRNIKGDLITLVQEKLGCTFPQALNKISNIVNFTEQDKVKFELPFDGFYKKIKRRQDNNYVELNTFDESILDRYLIMPSKLFLDDGISIAVQKKYKIGYDLATNRVVVCWRSLDGMPCGIMGRINKKEVDKGENKWLPILAFPKSKTLFGYSENYKNIQEHNIVFIGESEKFPMALETNGIGMGIGLGGNTLNTFQANNIKSLFPKLTLIMLDEGLEEEHSVHMAEQLKIKGFIENQVGYVYDKNGLFLPTGSKMSPSDLPLEDIKRLMNHCIKWV